MTNYEYQIAILAEIDRVQKELEGQGYPHCSIVVQFDLKSIRTAGTALWDCDGNHVIRINLAMAKANWKSFLPRTPGHEVCHIYSCECWGQKDGRGHGIGWKQTMRDAGLDPVRCHSYDTSSLGIRQKRGAYSYRCACKEHIVSTIIHNRIQKGISYSCNKCKQVLVRNINVE